MFAVHLIISPKIKLLQGGGGECTSLFGCGTPECSSQRYLPATGVNTLAPGVCSAISLGKSHEFDNDFICFVESLPSF